MVAMPLPQLSLAMIWLRGVWSSLKFYQKRLQENLIMHQAFIDEKFLPGMHMHVRSNAIFSDVLKRRFYQANGVLDSMPPFHKLMRSAGLSKSDAWNSKMLTYL